MINLIMQTTPAGGAIAQFVPLILIFVIFYVFLIMPQQRRMKAHKAMLAAVMRGDTVVTNGGIVGKVKKVSETELTLDLGATEVKVVRSMIADVRNKTVAANDGKAK